LKTLLSWIDLRPARAPHPPRAEPDPPGCPPGRVTFFEAQRSLHHTPPIRQRCCSRVT